MGFKVKKGNVEVDYGATLPTFNTPPQSPCSPIKEQERQATMPSGHSKGKSREDLGRGQVELFKIKSRRRQVNHERSLVKLGPGHQVA